MRNVELFSDRNASVPNRIRSAGNRWDLNLKNPMSVPNRNKRAGNRWDLNLK